MTYFNQIKDIEIKLPDIPVQFGGEWQFEVFKGFEFPRGSGNVFEYPGTRRVVCPWFHNLVTDFGLDQYGLTNSHYQYCHVGTGTTPETVSDTALDAFVASTGTISDSFGAETSAPYWAHHTSQYRFSPGFGGGPVNLNEVGGSTTTGTGSLATRALTVNGSGTPTTISVLADEYLDVYYKRRNYPAHLTEATGAPTDPTGSIDVSGSSHGYTVRPCIVTYAGSKSVSTNAGWAAHLDNAFGAGVGYAFHLGSRAMALDEDATLGAVTGFPGGYASSDNETTYGSAAYTPTSYARELWWQWGITDANFAPKGIGGLVLKTTLGCYSVIFDTPIMKVLGEVFTYYHDFSWTQKTTWI